MFIYGTSQKDKWFFSPEFKAYQRVNSGVYCYVIQSIGFYTLQLYERGNVSFCTLEARSHHIESLFDLAEYWLHKYYAFPESMKNDPYNVNNPNWRENCWV